VRITRYVVGLALLGAVGCGEAKPLPKSGRKVTPEEFRRMTPAERDDPYVLDNLEKQPPARRK
jgi:hypothetical protein